MAVLLLVFFFYSPARAETLREACANEISLLCPKGADAALRECLAEYAESATPPCRAKLGRAKPTGKTADVWGSAVAASGGGIAQGFEAKVTPAPDEEPAKGFDLSIQEEPVYYHFAGKTPADLVAGMGASGITDGVDGSQGAASTGASLFGNYTGEKKIGGCGLAGAKLTLVVRQRLPQWDAPVDAAAGTAQWWAKVFGAIKTHEEGHKRIDVDSGRAALQYLQKIGEISSCAQLDNVVAAEMQRANIEAMQQNVAYDQRTRHGQTQYDEAFGKGER